MIRRALLHLVNRLARRRDERIVQVGDMLTFTDPTVKSQGWRPDVPKWYLRGSDE